MAYPTLAHYEADLKKELAGIGWKEWYDSFKPVGQSSEREILKQVRL